MLAHGATRILVDGAFTASFDEITALVLAVTWLVAITVAAAAMVNRLAHTEMETPA